MDAHVFRRLAVALAPILHGARLEKIQSPVENVFVLTIYSQKRKQHLVLKASRRDPFLYLAKQRPVAMASPSAPIMRMRKYCVGRRIASYAIDWLNRKILLLFSTGMSDDFAPNLETWLVLDLREGLKLVLGSCPPLPPDDENIEWPKNVSEIIADAEKWRDFPMLSPALRRSLAKYDELDAQALLMDLQVGGGDLFVYGEGLQAEIFAWPLPPNLAGQKTEQVFEDPIIATALIGDALVLGTAAERMRSAEALPQRREINRLNRLLQKLDDEELRLKKLASLQEQGLILQNIMWQYSADTKLDYIETEDAKLELDPRFTLSENMQKFFHKAGRGRRGLNYLKERRQVLEQQLHAVENTMTNVLAGANTNSNDAKKLKKTENSNSLASLNLPKGIEAFSSVDNFIILRGKDAKGNWAALRAASAHDLWLHVEGGPGSHCIIRRHFAGQDIPESTIKEAAKLAAIKSWQKDSPHADIICAEVRHVKPMRNAPAGTVRIDKVWRSFRVTLTDS